MQRECLDVLYFISLTILVCKQPGTVFVCYLTLYFHSGPSSFLFERKKKSRKKGARLVRLHQVRFINAFQTVILKNQNYLII